MYFLFYAKAFNDVKKFQYLNSKIWFSPEQKDLLKRNKKDFSLFHKCSLLDSKNELAKT